MKKINYTIILILFFINKNKAEILYDTILNCSTYSGKVIIKKIKRVKLTYQMDSTLFILDYNTKKDFLKLFEKRLINRSCFRQLISEYHNYYGEYYEWKNAYKTGKPPYIGNFKGNYIMVANTKKSINKITGHITYDFVTYYSYGMNSAFNQFEVVVDSNPLKNENAKIISLIFKGTPI